MSHPQLQRDVPAGQPIKPWLLLGPFYEDLSATIQGLTLHESPGAAVGKALLDEVAGQAAPILQAAHREGQEAGFRNQTGSWTLVRRPDKYLSWGEYFIANHLGAAFLTTLVTPGQPGIRQCRLVTGLPSRVILAVDGRTVFDSSEQSPQPLQPDYLYTFEAELQAGENRLTLALFRLARMAQVGFHLQADQELQVRVPLAENLAPQTRAAVEEEVAGVRIARDVFYPQHDVGLRLETSPGAGAPLRVHLHGADGAILHERTPVTAGPVAICPAAELADGAYHMTCTWEDAAAAAITAVAYDIHKVTPVPAPQGYERLAERKQTALDFFAGITGPDSGRPDIWREVARYALGRHEDLDEERIRRTCAFIAARKDCADFVIQGILRLLAWDRVQPRLNPELQALIKDTLLGFKYWVDEPGDTVMYMGSENHRLLFHVAEWMAGQLYPTEEFTNSRQRGLYHATKGRMYITEWLRQRGRFGFDEWHSNSYYPICIAPLLNVYDFAIYEDTKLRQMAGAVLDTMFFNLAADSLQGVFGTTHGRSYARNVKNPDFEGTAPACWLLYGTGSLGQGSSGMAPVSIATSHYPLPRILADIATDDRAVVESRQRQGILQGSARHADFCVYRTPDYLISGLQDHRKGEFEPSTHVAQVTLQNKAVIFWSCPVTSGEGSGLRPDYWSGNVTLPRVVQYRNVMALTWRLSQYAWMTHCFFERDRFDESRLQDNWAFARVGKGYVGIYSQRGMQIGDAGPYAGRELICTAAQNTWIVECGREADWGSFDAFVAALASASVEEGEDFLAYHSPSAGRFVTGWDVPPTVAGEPIQLHGYPLVESPWASARFGSGELAIRYESEVYEVWFNQ